MNRLMGNHHRAGRLKKLDREIVALYAALCRSPRATCRRRVDLLIRAPKGSKRCDPDAFWKSLLDALVRCGQLVDDSDRYVAHGSVGQALEGPARTEITLTDCP